MTSTAIALNLEQTALSLTLPVDTIKRGWRGCVKVHRHHSDLISSLSNLTLNTIILAAKIFHQIPEVFSRSAYVMLNFTGICWLNMQFRDFVKSGKDFYAAHRTKDFEGMACTAAKVMVKGLNILLTCGMFAASIFSLCVFPEITLMMYAIMRPFSLFSLVVGIGAEVYDYKKNSDLIRKITVIEKANDREQRTQNIMRHFLNRLLSSKKNKEPDDPDKRLAQHLFRQLEHFTLETFRGEIQKKYPNILDKLGPDDIKKLFSALTKALQDKQTYTKTNLWLIGLGYMSMAIYRLWPETLIQSSTTWGMSLLYTSKLLYQKNQQAKLRDSL